MEPLRARQRDMARRQAEELVRRCGRELRIARVSLGMSQSVVARHARIPQSSLSEIERGIRAPDLGAIARVGHVIGLQVSVRFFPSGAVHLRDSGQLSIAQALIRIAAPTWTAMLEHPIGRAPDLRAADLVLVSSGEVVDVEIERNLADFQAQLRSGMLKRDVLSQRYSQPVRFVLAMPDTARLRRIVTAHAQAIEAALPRSSHEVLVALRAGQPLGADGLLWVRERRLA